jgi:hypothetical protein
MIRGWFTDIPLRRGRDGIRTLGSGLGGLISHSELVSESGGGVVLDGDGVIGDSTGTTIMRGLTAEGTTRGAGRFITGAPMPAADLHGAVVLTVPEGPGHSMETGARLGDTQLRAVRAGCARGRLAATTTAERRAVFRPAEARASAEDPAAVEDRTVAEAGGGDGDYLAFLIVAGF